MILTPRYAPRLRPTPIPASGAFDAPLVCLTVNRKWAAHILGALDVLDQPDTWIGTPEQIEAARQSVRQIKVALSLGNCTDTGEAMFDIRLKPNNNCIIQKTLDGGVTWIDAIDMSNCWKTGIRRNPATGETGYYDGIDFYRFPDGAWIDPPPSGLFPPPRDDRSGTEHQKRCDAAYGAALALQGLYRETFDALANVLEDGLWIVAGEVVQWLSVYIGAPLDPATLALTMSFLENAAGYESNGFPDSELENVQNDLYCNSSVTNGAVIFDRAAISSLWQTKDSEPYGGLRSLIDFFLGDEGLNAAGNVQAGTGDCSGADCLSPTCPTITFEDGDEQYTILKGSLIAGVGESGGTVLAAQQTSPTLQELLLEFPVSCNITSITYRMKYQTNRGDNLLTRTVQVWYDNNTQSTTVGTGDSTHAPQDTWITGSLNPYNVTGATKVRFGLAWSRALGATGYVYVDSITINGTGV
ncbi:MAG TPA: hypothetical protein VHS96_01720 [Bacteroidia bacterium]|nr:hypothetical protein [Bacteroidia bacterium]